LISPGEFSHKAHIITLEQNYRSTQPILDACNAVIGFAKERFTKNLCSDRRSKQKPHLTTVVDETAQARHVAEDILAAREAGVPLKSQAVLFRASHHTALLELELIRNSGRRRALWVQSETPNHVRDEGSFPPKRSPGAGDGCAAKHPQPLLLVAEVAPIADAGAGDPGICKGASTGLTQRNINAEKIQTECELDHIHPGS
jgi:hypothetical protein